MITDAGGKPIITETQMGRSITIHEAMQNGKLAWAVDFKPDVRSFEFEEIIMILGDVTRALAQNARAHIHEARAMAQVKAKMQELNK